MGSKNYIEAENDYYRYYCSNGRSFIFDRCDLPFFEKNSVYC